MKKAAKTTEALPADAEVALARKRRRAGRLECELGLGIGLLGLAASRLGQLWIAFDVFSQFTLQFALVTAAFLVGRLMPRLRLLTVFFIIAAGLVAIGLWPHAATKYASVLDTAKAGERELKVAQFNSWYDNPDIDAVRAEIDRIDADIITLVEFGPNHRPILKQLAGRYPYNVECFAVTQNLPGTPAHTISMRSIGDFQQKGKSNVRCCFC